MKNNTEKKSNKLKGIIFIIIILLLIFTIVYFSCRSSKTNKQVVKPNAITANQSQSGEISKVFDGRVFFPEISENNFIALYNQGRFFYKFNLSDGKNEKISDTEILDPEKIFYSKSGNMAIAIGNYPEKYVKLLNFATKKTVGLDNKIESVSFSKEQNKIFYSYFDSDKNTWQLSTADPAIANWQIIIELKDKGDPDFIISPKEDKALIFYSWPNVTKKSPSYIVELGNKKISEIDNKIEIKNALFSPDGSKIAYLDGNNKLNIYDFGSSSNKDTGIYTEINKLDWMDENQLIAAIPENVLDYSNEPTQDNIYIINVLQNQNKKINTNLSTAIPNITFIKFQNNYIYYLSEYILNKIMLK